MVMMATRGRRRLCCKFLCGVSLAQNQYTYSQVTKITNNFSKVLGKGAFGVVYRGVMKDQQEVAVKMLNRASIYDIKQFTAEVQELLTIRHKNLVSLIGYCDEDVYLALIYEFVENGDLKDHLSGKFGEVLSWESRMKISVGVAQGLEYLHTLEKNPQICQAYNNFETSSVWKALEFAFACVHDTSSKRPSMSHVVMELNECLSLEMAQTRGRAGGDNARDSVITMTMSVQ